MLVFSILVGVVLIIASIESQAAQDKIIVDCDAGTDDAMALFILLLAEKQLGTEGPKIIALTTVAGNTYIDRVSINVLKVLKLADRLDIPVYQGIESPLINKLDVDDYFGVDGLGDVEFPLDPPDKSLLQKKHAVRALVELVDETPGEIVLLALGPLSNVALAIKHDKNFLKKLKKLVILGGSVEGKGNKSPGVEFNFSVDPESNYIVLNGAEYRNDTVHLLSWEHFEGVSIPAQWRKEVFGAIDTNIVKFLNSAEHIESDSFKGSWIFADPIAAALTLHPEIVGKIKTLHVVPLLQGEARGGMLIDHYNQINDTRKINILEKLDTELYKQLLLKYFSQ